MSKYFMNICCEEKKMIGGGRYNDVLINLKSELEQEGFLITGMSDFLERVMEELSIDVHKQVTIVTHYSKFVSEASRLNQPMGLMVPYGIVVYQNEDDYIQVKLLNCVLNHDVIAHDGLDCLFEEGYQKLNTLLSRY